MYRQFFIFRQMLVGFLFILAGILPAISFAQATICGSVFLDQNQNHTKDSGELLRANQVVYLIDWALINQGQGGYFTTVTGENGQYCFLANTIGDYGVFTDIPTDMTLITPVEATGAMEPYSVKITSASQQLVVDFGFLGTVNMVWGRCQDESKDDSVCVSNADYTMQVTPNGGATEVTSMAVVQDSSGVYRGDNTAAKVVAGENDAGTRSARKTRDGSDEFAIVVGKNISPTGEEVALDATVNPDNSVSFVDPTLPTVEVTAHADGTYTGMDSTSPSVAVAFDTVGNITATDSDDPTMSLVIDKTTGTKTVKDSEYPTSMAIINPDGSYTVTDEEFPNLIATVYENNEYVVQDLANNMVVHIDPQGNYTVIDNKSGVCVAIPNTRGFWKDLWNGVKKVVSGVVRFVSKVAGFVAKVARFVVKVTRVISAIARVVAKIAKIAAVLFPPLCPLFCAVAAFAEGVAKVSGAVGAFADRVAYLADRIKEGADLVGWWISPARKNSVCDFETPQRCFGASGPGCQIIPDPVHPVTLDTTTCIAKGFVTVGSILHDICCFKQAQKGEGGHMCRGNLLATACKAEWDKATNDTTNDFPYGHGWYVNFGPYVLGSQGDDVSPSTQSRRRSQLGVVDELVATRRLSAPSETKLDIADVDFCQSGLFSRVEPSYGVCQ